MNNVLRDNELYLDEVAMEAMKVILMRNPTNRIDDSKVVAKAAYGMALAMLDVKRNLPKIAMGLPVLKDLQDDVRKNRASEK